MIELAGGESVLGTAGEKSYRTTWEDVTAAEPDLIVVAPCGYDRPAAQELADDVGRRGLLPAGVRARRRRQRLLGAAQHPAHRRDRGAGRGPPSVIAVGWVRVDP